MSEWRYSRDKSTGTIMRGRLYRTDDPDAWQHYTDSDGVVAFYDEGWRGMRVVEGADKEASGRALVACFAMRYDPNALKKVAVRLARAWDWPEPEQADFIEVNLDWGISVFWLTSLHDEDDVRNLRREIESVWHGDIYRMGCEKYVQDHGLVPDQWLHADDVYDEWYGEENAIAAHEKEFPLAEFPAEALIGSDKDAVKILLIFALAVAWTILVTALWSANGCSSATPC